MTAITYIGRNSGFCVKLGKRNYDFEWQKSLGIGKSHTEVDPRHATVLSGWKDKSGKKMFRVE